MKSLKLVKDHMIYLIDHALFEDEVLVVIKIYIIDFQDKQTIYWKNVVE
jgi:hypothetical protein